MVELKAPQKYSNSEERFMLFLAGSIEMGKAELWQERVSKSFQEENILILNPRRDDWNSSWIQDISDENFKEQVTWELDGLDASDLILMYFSPETKSPISLLELGLYAGLGKVIVVCPEGFWRRGNVQIVCERYGLQIFDTLEEGIAKANQYYQLVQLSKLN
jgi:hypothetical protein